MKKTGKANIEDRKTRNWAISASGIFVIHSILLFLELLYSGGQLSTLLLNLAAGLPLVCFILIVYTFIPWKRYMPLYMSLIAQVAFLAAGIYKAELSLFFFFMFLLVDTITRTKNFKLLLIFVLASFSITILVFIFAIPRLDWLNPFRFFMQFVMYLYGSIFMLIQTRNVEQKEDRSEQALTAFSSLLNSTPNFMVITDSHTRVRYISDPMAKFAHFSSQELAVDKPLLDLFSDKKLKLMFADILDAEGFIETAMTIDINGEERHFKVVADKLGGEAEGIFIDIADITPLVRSQQAAMEAQLAAEEASKSKSNFLATMSHEIRTPMNAIIGISQIQLQNENLPKEYNAALHQIYTSGSNLLGIINDILDMSKIETGKMELNPVEYDISSLINDTVQLNIVRIGSKFIKFSLDIDENLPLRLFGDELRLKQILNNLLSNAIKYTEKGHVKLSVKHSSAGEDVRLHFIVEDTGQGIKPEDLKKLFSEYMRFNVKTNRTTEGVGLGLTITKRLLELMDGTIEAESEYGKGSIFKVTVKQKVVECGASGRCEVIGKDVAERLQSFTFAAEKQDINMLISREYMPNANILVVDDIDTNLYVAEGFLKPYGVKIEMVDSGYAALEKIEIGNIYDIIFMDHMMPGMDGIETTKRLRDAGYTQPIIALTANALVGQVELFLKNGFDDFISKPIDIVQLDRVLKQWIAKEKREKRKENIEPKVREQLTSNSEQLLESSEEIVPSISGVNTQQGIAMTGGTAVGYRKVLSMFCKDAEKRLPVLQTMPEVETLTGFITQVHALKSASASIGAAELSAEAEQLEAAGNEGDLAYIHDNLPGFAVRLAELAKNVRTALAETADDPVSDGTQQFEASGVLLPFFN
ncbi:MAG: response regulator, partial [Tannerella sp.]|nr:response regulator [Tannerella sp.]